VARAPRTDDASQMNIRSIMKMCCNRHKQFNTHSWGARRGNVVAQNSRKPFSGRGSAPDPARGAYSAYSAPQTPSWWGGRLAAPSPTTAALGTSSLASPVSPLQNCAPQCPQLMQAGDAPESHIGYDLVFSCKVGVYWFCIQARGLVFGYISTVVKCVVCVMQFAQFCIRTYATKLCESLQPAAS